MAVAPWEVSDQLWERIEPLLPKVKRRARYPGRKRLPDRQALQGILFVLHTAIAWRHLPLELGFGSGSTCYRRLDEWQRAGVWERLHALLLRELRAASELPSLQQRDRTSHNRRAMLAIVEATSTPTQPPRPTPHRAENDGCSAGVPHSPTARAPRPPHLALQQVVPLKVS
jgi:transposase